MRPRSPSRRLADQNRRLRAQVAHMSAQVEIAIACLGDSIESEQGPNQAARHLFAALGGDKPPAPRATAIDNENNEVF